MRLKTSFSKRTPLVIFIIASILDFWAIYENNQQVITIVKPMLMLSLLWYYIANTKNRDKLYVLAITFSFLGDVFLLNKELPFFISGLVSFLIAHIFYIAIVKKKLKYISTQQWIQAIIPNLIIFFALLSLLYDGLGGLKIPVIIYAVTICAFGVLSCIYYFQKKTISSIFLITGAYTFILSDSLLAIQMFYKPYTSFPIMIMLSYVLAQFLICKFALSNK